MSLISGYSNEKLLTGKSFEIAQQIICGENCTFVIHSNGAVSACGEGSNGRLGLGNSDDYDTLTLISALRGLFFRLLLPNCKVSAPALTTRNCFAVVIQRLTGRELDFLYQVQD